MSTITTESNSVIVPNNDSTQTPGEAPSTTTLVANATDVTETSSEASSSATSTTTLVEENVEAEETTDALILRFSVACRPFGLPKYPEVAKVAREQFDDPMIMVTNRMEGSEEVFKFELNNQVPKYGNSLSFLVEGITYKVDLQPVERYTRYSRRQSDRENNILLTFHGAGQKKYDNITMQKFDSIIENDLKLTLDRPTEKQRIPQTPIFNGNRFCVVKKPDNLAVIPEFLPIEDPVTKELYLIKVTYWGQLINCARCNKQHPRGCPELKEFYAAKDERQRMRKENEVKSKIISDSTLRHADQIGLRADVMTMSGGGLGQVLQAAIDDPDTKDKACIVIVGGTNDVKNRTYETQSEFAQNIKSTVDKVLEYASSEPEKKITLVNSHPRIDNSSTSPDEQVDREIRERYLHKKLDEVIASMPNMVVPITNVDIIDVHYDVDDTGHPTIEGTKEILNTLNDFLDVENKLIWNEKYITSEKRYRGVQSIYKYGCNHCPAFGQSLQHTKYFNSNLCDDCMDLVKANAPLPDPLLETICAEVRKKYEDPPLKKRGSNEVDDTNPKQKVVCISNDTAPQTVNDNGCEDEEMPLQQ